MCSTKIFLAMIFNEIECHVNTSLGLVGGCIPPVSAPDFCLDSLFAGMTLALHTDGAHFSGFVQCELAVHSVHSFSCRLSRGRL